MMIANFAFVLHPFFHEFTFFDRPPSFRFTLHTSSVLFYRVEMQTQFSLSIVAVSALLLLSGCDRQEYIVERPVPVISTPPVSEPNKTPPKSNADAPKDSSASKPDGEKLDAAKERELPIAHTGFLIDGFEGPEFTVWAFDSADDEGGTAQYVDAGATQGKKALQITLRDKGKSGKIQSAPRCEHGFVASPLRCSSTSPAPSDKFTLVVALTCGPHDIYQESKVVELKALGAEQKASAFRCRRATRGRMKKSEVGILWRAAGESSIRSTHLPADFHEWQ